MLLGQLSTQSASPGCAVAGEDPATHAQAGACARVPFLSLKPLISTRNPTCWRAARNSC